MIFVAFLLLFAAFVCFILAAAGALLSCGPYPDRHAPSGGTLLLLIKASGVLSLSALGCLAIGLVE